MQKIFLFSIILFVSNLTFIPFLVAEEKTLPNLPPVEKSLSKEKNQNYKEGEVIIQYRNKAKKEKALNEIKNKTDNKNLDLEIKGEIENLDVALVKSQAKSTQELIQEFENDESVEIVEPNYKKELAYIPNDTYYSMQWSHFNSGQTISATTGTIDADIDSSEAWDIESSSATDTLVAVIDSGVEYDYSDLTANMWDGTNCVDEFGIPIVGGCPNHGWDYEDSDDAPYDTMHGTFIANLIAGEINNGIGIAGLSRYNRLKIMALKFDLTLFTELKAISFAKHNGAKVINASFVGADFSQAEKNAIDGFDGIFVTAAGNDAANNELIPTYPCNYTSANIICVASSNQTDSLSSFSSYGASSVDIAAPGENLLGRYDSAYYSAGGTSFATPLVAGAAALLYAHRPEASIATIRSTLLQSSDHKTSLSGKVTCNRRLNLNTALQSILNNEIPTETCAGSVYRFWSDTKQHHFYTTNETEKNNVIDLYDDSIWRYEGVGYYAYATSQPETVPVYRFWSDTKQGHFYTAGEAEKNKVIATYPEDVWKYEGVAFYVYPTEKTGVTPIYRFWSDTKQGHFYTASEDEKNHIIATYLEDVWKYEGVAWYVPTN